MIATAQQCPLCKSSSDSSFFHRDTLRDFYRCQQCALIFVPPVYFLSPEEEKAEYDQHQNSPDDAGYRTFLSQLFSPMLEKLVPESKGLDFGSGPGPTLSVMFEEQGHRVALYDPFYAPDRNVLGTTYDFVCASEVIEHFQDPEADLQLIWTLVKPGGWLGIMTGMAQGREAFARWRYKDDRSHITFFSVETMEWIARKWQADLFPVAKSVFLFQKP